MRRRDFVKLLGAGASSLFLPAYGRQNSAMKSQEHGQQHRVPQKPGFEGVARLLEYVDPLPIPSRLQPVRKTKGALEYKVRLVQFKQRLHSQLPPATLWGYEGKYPGPVIEAMANEPVRIEWINQLPEKHL